MGKQRKRKIQKKEKPCKHQWAPLLAKYKGQVISTATKICLKCGEIKMGERTVKISRFRLSIEGGTKLKIPVGTDLYS
jgi:hypothetical protein